MNLQITPKSFVEYVVECNQGPQLRFVRTNNVSVLREGSLTFFFDGPNDLKGSIHLNGDGKWYVELTK